MSAKKDQIRSKDDNHKSNVFWENLALDNYKRSE